MNRDFNITKGTRISDRTTALTAIKHGVYSALLKAAFLIGLVVALRATARAATDLTLAPNLSSQMIPVRTFRLKRATLPTQASRMAVQR
jgi:hypothetical protein